MTNASSTPLVSVVVAVRNAAPAIAATLKCLADQAFRDFEVLLIDGASTDATVAIAKQSGQLISTIVSESDDGIADAWNKGVSLARGDWLVFLNAGDLLHADHFARAAVELTASRKRHVLFCDVLKFQADGKPTHTIVGRAPTLRGIRRGSVGFAHPGSFTSRDAFAEVGLFDKSIRIAIDTDFLLRCIQAGFTFTKFCSTAYMAEGGISDVWFGQAMREYFASAQKHGFVTSTQAARLTLLLPQARRILHLLRATGRGPARLFKHVLVAALNMAAAPLVLHTLRRLYFRALGFKLGAGSSIGMGLRFYKMGGVSIGSRSVVNRDCLLDNRDHITIGSDVSIARNVHIYTAGHDPDSPFFEMITSPVVIEDHAVVFARCTIMPGVRIGRGAVVYGGSVVTRDVPACTIVGGSPAKPIRMRHAEPLYRLDYPYPLAM